MFLIFYKTLLILPSVDPGVIFSVHTVSQLLETEPWNISFFKYKKKTK